MGVGVGVSVGTKVLVGVGVFDEVGARVGVSVAVGSGVTAGRGVGVGVGVAIPPQLLPRRLCTTALPPSAGLRLPEAIDSTTRRALAVYCRAGPPLLDSVLRRKDDFQGLLPPKCNCPE